MVFGVHVCRLIAPIPSPTHPPANFVKHFCLKPLISYTFYSYVMPVSPCIPNLYGKLILLLKAG